METPETTVTYKSRKTKTSYVVTYRNQTKEFQFMGDSGIAWKEAEAWMRERDLCSSVRVCNNGLVIESTILSVNIATANKEGFAKHIELALNSFEGMSDALIKVQAALKAWEDADQEGFNKHMNIDAHIAVDKMVAKLEGKKNPYA